VSDRGGGEFRGAAFCASALDGLEFDELEAGEPAFDELDGADAEDFAGALASPPCCAHAATPATKIIPTNKHRHMFLFYPSASG
jgi:hypothetical protein